METVVINGVTYAPVMNNDNPAKIVVLQRGWVVAGILSTDDKTGNYILSNSCVIRKWGTTKGLPELTKKPLKDTVLDKCDTVMHFHPLSVVLMIDIDKTGWNL